MQRWGDAPGSGIGQLPILRGLAGVDGVEACWDLLRLSERSDGAEGGDRIRPSESLKAEVIPKWSPAGKNSVITEGYNGSPSPALWSIEAFFYLSSSPPLAPASFYVSFFRPVSFYTCVLCCFSFWFPLDLYRFSSFAFLFWCGLDCACSVFWSLLSPRWVWVFFQSLVLIWWCLTLLLLNVQSVAFVQGKCWQQCNLNKCWNLSWIFFCPFFFFTVSWVHDEVYVCFLYSTYWIVSIKETSLDGWIGFFSQTRDLSACFSLPWGAHVQIQQARQKMAMAATSGRKNRDESCVIHSALFVLNGFTGD